MRVQKQTSFTVLAALLSLSLSDTAVPEVPTNLPSQTSTDASPALEDKEPATAEINTDMRPVLNGPIIVDHSLRCNPAIDPNCDPNAPTFYHGDYPDFPMPGPFPGPIRADEDLYRLGVGMGRTMGAIPSMLNMMFGLGGHLVGQSPWLLQSLFQGLGFWAQLMGGMGGRGFRGRYYDD